MDSSEMMGNSLEVLMNFNHLFLTLNWFICNQRWVPLLHWSVPFQCPFEASQSGCLSVFGTFRSQVFWVELS